MEPVLASLALADAALSAGACLAAAACGLRITARILRRPGLYANAGVARMAAAAAAAACAAAALGRGRTEPTALCAALTLLNVADVPVVLAQLAAVLLSRGGCTLCACAASCAALARWTRVAGTGEGNFRRADSRSK